MTAHIRGLLLIATALALGCGEEAPQQPHRGAATFDRGKALVRLTTGQLRNVVMAIEAYRADHGKPPPGPNAALARMIDGDPGNGGPATSYIDFGQASLDSRGRIVDAWNRPLRYVVTGDGYRLWSIGADGQDGTGDDVQLRD